MQHQMKAFQNRLEECLKQLQNLKLIYSKKEGWVVESKNHVNVGEGHGLNHTAFAVKSPMSCAHAIVWNSQEEAEKYGMDYYLVDGKGKSILMKTTKAFDFFNKEVENTKELLLFIKEHTDK